MLSSNLDSVLVSRAVRVPAAGSPMNPMPGSEGGNLRHFLGVSGIASPWTSKEVGKSDPNKPGPGGPAKSPGPPDKTIPGGHYLKFMEAEILGARGLGTALVAGGLQMVVAPGNTMETLKFAGAATIAMSVGDVAATVLGFPTILGAYDYRYDGFDVVDFISGAVAYIPLGMVLGDFENELFINSLLSGLASLTGGKVGSLILGIFDKDKNKGGSGGQ